MTTVLTRVNALYDAGRVKRLHCKPTVAEHTVAAHVYGSLVLAVELCSLNLDARLDKVMLALLYHDAAEVETGDIPAPVKRMNLILAREIRELETVFERLMELPLPNDLTELEKALVKACDTLDLAFNVLHEWRMGNTNPWVRSVFCNCLRYLEDQGLVPGVNDFLNYLSQLSETMARR